MYVFLNKNYDRPFFREKLVIILTFQAGSDRCCPQSTPSNDSHPRDLQPQDLISSFSVRGISAALLYSENR